MFGEFIRPLLSVISFGILLRLFRILLGWLDAQVGAPVMSERINGASDRFFTDDVLHRGESEIDDVGREFEAPRYEWPRRIR